MLGDISFLSSSRQTCFSIEFIVHLFLFQIALPNRQRTPVPFGNTLLDTFWRDYRVESAENERSRSSFANSLIATRCLVKGSISCSSNKQKQNCFRGHGAVFPWSPRRSSSLRLFLIISIIFSFPSWSLFI